MSTDVMGRSALSTPDPGLKVAGVDDIAELERLTVVRLLSLAKVAKPRTRKPTAWTAEEAKTFLEAAQEASDPFYAAYVLILVQRGPPRRRS
ncbi:hypothetical protein [Dactylosporangium sp. NPDC006015]|uniref:hypothetical protein n=1 Tax=Dactylosporangium sp. NPDC006015 TaxID=3154576 RepID=UPI0033A51306